MLRRKLWRDMKKDWGAYLACVSVLVIGLMLFIAFSLTLKGIQQAQDNFYEQYKFEDGYANIGSAPNNLIDEVRKVEGIENAVGRYIKDVNLYIESGDRTTTVRLVSTEQGQSINLYRLEEGVVPQEGAKEILVSTAFLTKNNLKIGESIKLLINGVPIEFRITGTANSPEYIYEVQNKQMLVPSPTEFGVAFLSYRTITDVFEADGNINDLVFTLKKEYTFENIKDSLESLLKPYGLQELASRSEQLSHLRLVQQINQLTAIAYSTPIMFLLISAIILYIMLKRIVEKQRGQIGLLKAFGFSNSQIFQHYLGFAVTIGLTGGLLGGIAGSALSYPIAHVYRSYYKLPELTGGFDLIYFILAIAVSLIFCLIAGYRGCRKVLKLDPSEAMRQSVMTSGKRMWLERIRPLWGGLNTSSRMAMRNLVRNKPRTILSITGTALAFSMMVATIASIAGIYKLVDFQFYEVQRYQLKAYINTTAAELKAMRITGLKTLEIISEVPVTLQHNENIKEVNLTGLPKDSSLYQLKTDDGEKITLPQKGVILSNQLAAALNVQKEGTLSVRVGVGEGIELNLEVVDIVPQYVELGAYMDYDVLQTILKDQNTVAVGLYEAET